MALILSLSDTQTMDDLMDDAAAILLSGGVIAYPTETFYGLGVDATSERAIRKLFDIKGRNFNKPVSVIIGDLIDLAALVENVTTQAKHLMDAFWPGPLTLVFRAAASVSPLLTANTGKIGIRLASHDLACGLARRIGRPLTATSANRAGAPECSTASAVIEQIGDVIDAVIDWEKTEGTTGSTIVDTTGETPVLLRQGVISANAIKQATGLPLA